MEGTVLFVLLLLSSSLVDARCGTHRTVAEKEENQRLLQERLRDVNWELRQSTVMINVYWHVITNGDIGVYPESQMVNQINVLNQAFSTTGFQFRLRRNDTTNNANWMNMDTPSAAERQMKTATHFGTLRDLNIWTTTLANSLLGWAYFPDSRTGVLDGLVITSNCLPGGSSSSYNLGITAVHEIGHWFGLDHTFEGGCTEPNDYVADTPQEADATYGCPSPNPDTCTSNPGLDPIHNYMDYGDDICLTQFTPGQVARMQQQWLAFRNVAPGEPDIGTSSTSMETTASSTTSSSQETSTTSPLQEATTNSPIPQVTSFASTESATNTTLNASGATSSNLISIILVSLIFAIVL